jgi:hypothetical protein
MSNENQSQERTNSVQIKLAAHFDSLQETGIRDDEDVVDQAGQVKVSRGVALNRLASS